MPISFGSEPGWSSKRLGFAMRALKSAYPFLDCGVYGRSVAGVPLRYLRFGTGAASVIVCAAHHANEYITSPALVEAARRMASERTSGGVFAELFAKMRVYFVPLVNPDGVDLVNGTLTSPALLRAAGLIAARYSDVPYPYGWKANALGIDLNLQYPALWDEARRIKFAAGWVSPAPRDYVGRAPLCAPESRALYAFTLRVRPKAVCALHTQGSVIYWRFRGEAAEGAEALAGRLALASGYALDSVPGESDAAGYKDWAIDSLGIPAYTVECGSGENPLPEDQLPAISDAVTAICREMALWCAAY